MKKNKEFSILFPDYDNIEYKQLSEEWNCQEMCSHRIPKI